MMVDKAPFNHPWDELKLGEVATVEVGGTPSTSVPAYWENGTVPWMSSGDVHLRRIVDVPGRITETGLRSSNAKLIDPPCVAVALAGQGKTRGTVALALLTLSTNQSVALVKGQNGVLDTAFLFHALDARYEELRARSAGGGRAGLSKQIIEAVPLPLPSLYEQQRIAVILDTVDEAIRQTDAVIAKLNQMKAGLLHDLLTRGLDANGELRDQVAHPEQFKDSALGRIPAEWEISTLGALALGGITNGLFKKPDLVGQGFPLVNVLDLYQNFGIDLNLVERVDAPADEQSKYSVEPGDCFFTRSSLNLAGIAHCNIVREVLEPSVFECHVMRVRPDRSHVVPEFFAHWCRSSFARRFFMTRAKQTTMTTISQPDIADLVVPLPPQEEQALVIATLDVYEALIRREEATRDKLALLKRGLMDDLLTGRVRVTEGDSG